MKKISVMLVDDHAIVRSGIRAYLEVLPDNQITAEAESGAEAVCVWRNKLRRMWC